MSTLDYILIEQQRQEPSMAVVFLQSTTPNIHLNAEATDKAVSLLQSLLKHSHRLASATSENRRCGHATDCRRHPRNGELI